MSDLVSRQYLLDEYDRQHQGPPGGARKIIEEAPAVQEIIRCRECKFATMTIHGEVKYCEIWFPDEKGYYDGDNFCSCAERREVSG